MSQRVLSICIPTRDRAPYLERCLEHLCATAELPFGVEIVVSDNASSDATAEVCARFTDRLFLRYYRHDSDVGAERNVVSALRAATGRYAVYLGDDDRLDLRAIAHIIAMFEENPSLVCVQAPWQTRDDAHQRDLGLFYPVPEPAAFTSEQAWPCWQFILKNGVFPEIAVYRTTDLHAILHLPASMHWAFIWCFRLLGRGTVAFLPVPFYIHVVRPAEDLPPRTQLGVTQSTTHLDRYRGGLEWALGTALRRVAGHVPAEHRDKARRMLERFTADRSDVAARVAATQADFIGAVEHFTRARTFEAGVDRDGLQAFEREHTMLAGLQAVVQTAEGSAGCKRIQLRSIANVERVEALLVQLFGYDGEVVIDGALDPLDVVLVMAPGDRASAIEAGALPGRVLAWEELVDCFRVHNVLGALGRARPAEGTAA